MSTHLKIQNIRRLNLITSNASAEVEATGDRINLSFRTESEDYTCLIFRDEEIIGMEFALHSEEIDALSNLLQHTKELVNEKVGGEMRDALLKSAN